ncbi:fimbrial protein [Enterobacter sp. Ap-1006]|uniref:common pilus major fimbrillin subunit EcpA n=1 Tax=Enterobacter sp. Ap-1006 TaxID=2608345 RepID=UPI00142071EA|nr:common pilus major fimbrillin subunit EcpA [Enterobacter sp. Ap-1006]NIF48658.1 fimbrial protein [Enterobacter sp. Ap-1006]
MNKLAISVIAIAVLGSASMANAATRTATASASWDAKAIKDTHSMLVVTPIKSLTFNYAEGLDRFNSQDGAFDITIAGQSGASDFKLTSKIISNTLTRSSDQSALTVGVQWNGADLSASTPTVLVDTSKGVSAGLAALAQSSAYANSGRTSAQGVFAFNIAKATKAGTDTAVKDLADGYWDGNVNIEFTAAWDGEFTS